MKPETSFIPERALARHCPEMLRKGPAPEELLGLLGRMGQRLARRLSGALAPMLGGEAPPVSCGSAREGDFDQMRSSIARLAANSLFAVGSGAAPLLVSIEAEPVLRIVDRAFGGKGEAPAPLPDAFPMAADLMIGKLEALVGNHLAAAVGATEGGAKGAAAPGISALRRDGNLAMLAPFPEHLPLAIMTLEVDDGSVLPWLITLAMPMATVARLFGFPDAAPTAEGAQPGARTRMASATAEPFGELPLSVSAVIVDMRLSFAAVANLEVGAVLPVAVARQVPLRIGEQTIAHGQVGAVDDRVALRLTSAFQ